MPQRSTPSDDMRTAALHSGSIVVVQGTGEIADSVADAFRRHGALVQNALGPLPVRAQAAPPRAGGSSRRADVWVSVIGCPSDEGGVLEAGAGKFEAQVRHAVLGCLVRARAAARLMTPVPGGVVLTVLDTGSGPGPVAVTSTVQGLTRALAAELRPHGVRALGLRIRTAAHPGAPEPDADPLALFAQAGMYGRVCRPEQLGDIVCYLTSARTAPISGTFHTLYRSPPAR